MKAYEHEHETNSMNALELVRMSPAERRMARASLRQAEMIADMLVRADTDLRRAFGLVRRLFGVIVHHAKAPAVKPAPN